MVSTVPFVAPVLGPSLVGMAVYGQDHRAYSICRSQIRQTEEFENTALQICCPGVQSIIVDQKDVTCPRFSKEKWREFIPPTFNTKLQVALREVPKQTMSLPRAGTRWVVILTKWGG